MKAKITITQGYGETMSWETDHSDVTIDELLQGVYGCLIGLTWTPEVILNGMKEWAEENLETINYGKD